MITYCSPALRRLAAAAMALGMFVAACGGEPARETFASNPAQLSTTTGVAATPNATADTTTTTTTMPPLDGDVAAFDDPRFEAIYQCSRTDYDDASGYQIRYWWDGRMMTTPDVGSDIEQEVTEPIWHGDFFYQLRGSVGPAVILDGNPVSMPRASYDVDDSEDIADVHTYGKLVISPRPEQGREIAGSEWTVIPYKGAFTLNRDLRSESLGTVTTAQQEETWDLRSWYHNPTGLLMETKWTRTRTKDVNNYDGQTETGLLESEACQLISTTLDLTP